MPVSDTEAQFIAKLVENNQICQIVFVVSKMDTIYPSQREYLIKVIEERLQKLVKNVLLATHSKNDSVMDRYEDFFARPIVFPVSSTMALDAYEMGDQQLLVESGFQRLNNELLPIIISTQHNAAIMTPIGTIVKIADGFALLLQQWRQQTVDDDKLRELKVTFAETAYGVNLNNDIIWSTYYTKLNKLHEEHSNMVLNSILNNINKNRKQKNILIENISNLYQQLNKELTLEEINSYQQVWYEYIAPKYIELCNKLERIAQENLKVFNQIDIDLKNLGECTSFLNLTENTEQFYWENSPIPPDTLPAGQIAYFVDKTVRTSLYGYYQRREMRMKKFIAETIRNQEEKKSNMVRKLFLYIKTELLQDNEKISVEMDEFECICKQLKHLISQCTTTKEKYINEYKNENKEVL
jgi:hypothetical protein